jgi:RNA polymerase sigma-70 factor (ECF subfamily)
MPISGRWGGLGYEDELQSGQFLMMEGRPDSMLVEQAVRGDGDSFTELCRRYYGPMVAIGHAIIGDRHLAEDAAQQAFAKAAVNLPKLRDTGQFGRWVAAICRNEAGPGPDLGGQGERAECEWPTEQACVEGRSESPGARDTGTPSERGQDVRDTVKEALSRLPAEGKEVIFLRFYDGLSYDQISSVLGISEQAINGRLRRAKRKLAEHLRRRGFDEVDL